PAAALTGGGGAGPVALCRAAARAGSAAAGPGTGQGWPGAGRRPHRGTWGGQIAPGLRVLSLTPYAGLAAAREWLRVLRQGHGVPAGLRSAQSLLSHRGPR